MQETKSDYDKVINYFGIETIEDRYKYLYDKMAQYINARKLQKELIINEDILHQIVMDYFTDIYRLKLFHEIEHVNLSKIVAYEVYWIYRRKPIQIKDAVVGDARLVFANEGFLTTFIAHECLLPDELAPMAKEKEEMFLEYLKHINYHLKYRSVDKQCLEIMLYSFEVGKGIS